MSYITYWCTCPFLNKLRLLQRPYMYLRFCKWRVYINIFLVFGQRHRRYDMFLLDIGNFTHSLEVDNVDLMLTAGECYKMLIVTSYKHFIYFTCGYLLLSQLFVITNNNLVKASSYSILICKNDRWYTAYMVLYSL
jgi:hypothetical protein